MSRQWKAAAAALVFLAAACADTTDDAAVEAPADSPAAAAPVEQPAPAAATLIDPETATREQLVALPGMTEAAADALVAGRPYDNMLAVDAALAPHLDDAQREQLYASVWKPFDINTASSEEIQLIPGVGDRMTHEFEEYRPYTAIEQFRREMGKYVDEAEVARLEQYIRIGQ